MATLGIKIFYLRTRERKLSQQTAAEHLGVRQATLSHVERGKSLPAIPLLLTLCEFYDVSPSFLLDDGRGVVPLPSDRWSARRAVVTAGMWVEAPAGAVRQLDDGKLLCPLLPDERFYDGEAAALRAADGGHALRSELLRRAAEDAALLRALERELATHPKRRPPKR